VAEVQGVRTYVAEPARRGRRHWQDKAAGQQQAVYANRRRIRGQRGRRLGRWRSERAERSFAHVCETGGGRRTCLRGIANVSKSYLGRVAAHNLGLLMLALFGIGTPRSLQAGIGLLFALIVMVWCARRSRRWVQNVPTRFADEGTVQSSASPSGSLVMAT
jgi:transposase